MLAAEVVGGRLVVVEKRLREDEIYEEKVNLRKRR